MKTPIALLALLLLCRVASVQAQPQLGFGMGFNMQRIAFEAYTESNPDFEPVVGLHYYKPVTASGADFNAGLRLPIPQSASVLKLNLQYAATKYAWRIKGATPTTFLLWGGGPAEPSGWHEVYHNLALLQAILHLQPAMPGGYPFLEFGLQGGLLLSQRQWYDVTGPFDGRLQRRSAEETVRFPGEVFGLHLGLGYGRPLGRQRLEFALQYHWDGYFRRGDPPAPPGRRFSLVTELYFDLQRQPTATHIDQ